MFTIFAPMAIILACGHAACLGGKTMCGRALAGVGMALRLILLAIVVRMLPSYYIGLLTEALILGIFAMSLNLLLGHTGSPP